MAYSFSGMTDLPPGEVHVWSVELEGASQEREAFDLLAPDERTRADRLGLAVERRRFIHARVALRIILGGYLGQTPKALNFAFGHYGKPRLSGLDVPYFNLSHSGDLAMVAVCKNYPIGVDVEQMTQGADALDDIAQDFFSTKERAAYFAFQSAERFDVFYRIWTRKEAVAKALGLGMSLPGPSFDVSVEAEGPRVLYLAGGAEDWRLLDLAPGPGFVGALAARAPGLSVVMRPFTGLTTDR